MGLYTFQAMNESGVVKGSAHISQKGEFSLNSNENSPSKIHLVKLFSYFYWLVFKLCTLAIYCTPFENFTEYARENYTRVSNCFLPL